MKKLNFKLNNDTRRLFFYILSSSPINKQIVIYFTGYYQHSQFIQGIKCNALQHRKVQIIQNKTYHPFRERNILKKHKVAFFLNKVHIFWQERKSLNEKVASCRRQCSRIIKRFINHRFFLDYMCVRTYMHNWSLQPFSHVSTTIGSTLRNNPIMHRPRIVNSAKAVSIGSFLPREILTYTTIIPQLCVLNLCRRSLVRSVLAYQT